MAATEKIAARIKIEIGKVIIKKVKEKIISNNLFNLGRVTFLSFIVDF